MQGDHARQFWDAAARRLALRINLGWWLERCLPALIGITAAATCALLVWRWQGEANLRTFWIVLASVAALCVLITFFTVRRRFESAAQARVRLEDHLGLKTRLTSAAEGIGAWPERREITSRPVTWKWQRPVIALALCALCLAAAALVPISRPMVAKERVIEKPSSLQQVDAWMEKLREEKIADERDLETLQGKMDEILQRPAENWYEHASLEAADHLRDQTGETLNNMAKNFAKAAGAMNQMGALQPGEKSDMADQAEEEFRKAMEGLSSGSLKSSPSAMGELKNLDPSALKSMTSDQLKQMADHLAQNADLARQLTEGTKWEMSEEMIQGLCNKEGEGKGKQRPGPGNGEIQRGPGEAPLTLGMDGSPVDPTKQEALKSNLDLQRAAISDVTGVSNGQHQVDKGAFQNQSGGTLQTIGQGGDAVWTDSLLPSEREVLRKYFK
jgi:hypothetical protein